jgi:iduronate 2-sulfatase
LYGPSVWPDVPGVSTWGNTFRDAGYEAVSLGKIWHVQGRNTDTFDLSWGAGWKYNYADPANLEAFANRNKQRRKGIPMDEITNLPPITEHANVHDTVYRDGKLAVKAIRELERLAKQDNPFMMAVGFVKPHLPFCSPKKYWDLYDEDEIELAANPDFPENMPDIAFADHPNFYNYSYGEYPSLVHGKPMPDVTARHLRHAYRAAVSFVDAQVGLILDELKELGLEDNTIIVLWGDHGFHLGETGFWSKHYMFEWANHSPLIIKVPWMEHKEVQCDELVETVDIFPTLLDLCGIPELEVYDGRSMVPLLEDPDREWKKAVYHVWNRRMNIDGNGELIIGHAVRTEKYRYIRWGVGWGLQGQEVASELYDYTKKPYETRNLANDPEYTDICKDMKQLLREGPPGQFH